MTGFGSAERAGCRIEIRSLNQRFLEIYIKSPSFLNKHEMTFRNLLRGRFSRGKLDVAVTISGDGSSDLKVNKNAAGRIYRSLKSLQEDFSIPGDLDINGMAYFHEMFMEADYSYDINEIMKIFEEASEDLHSMRIREGRMLVEELTRLIDSLGCMGDEMKKLSAGAAPEACRRFREKVKLITEGREVDPDRMHQELAVLAAKFDISEEIARLDCHIRQFRDVLAGDDMMGRKLDFLVQELHREVNTMSSKSVDYGLSRLAVDMKTEIEKIREQVQNLQ